MAALSDLASPGPRLLDEVFSPAVLGALDRVRMAARHASGERPGHTPVRGRSDASGTELDRHATYAPGDDLRRVDWAAYARLGELLTRRYVAEREVPVWLVLDASGSMGPGGAAGKTDMAAAIAAILGIVSLSGGDRVHLAAIAGARPGTAAPRAARIGPLRTRRSLAAMHGFLAAIEPGSGPADLAAGLGDLLRDVRRAVVLLVSDFLVEPAALEAALDAIGTRRCEGRLVQVLSREDVDPSWLQGRDTLLDRETGEELRIAATPGILARYRAALEAQVSLLAAAAARRGMLCSLAVSDGGLRAFLREELPRLGLRLVR